MTITCDGCGKQYKTSASLTNHKKKCDIDTFCNKIKEQVAADKLTAAEKREQDEWDDDGEVPATNPTEVALKQFLTGKNDAPFHVTQTMGYRYKTPVDLIENKDDPELLIPDAPNVQFIIDDGVVDNASVRRQTLEWLLSIANQHYFSAEYAETKVFTGKYLHENIAIFCIGVELLDRTLATISGKLNVSDLYIIELACLLIAGKMQIDYINLTNINTEIAANLIKVTKKTISLTERLVLNRLNYNVSGRYTVPWFIDYLGGFLASVTNSVMISALVECYIDGSYRFQDPYTVAERLAGM